MAAKKLPSTAYIMSNALRPTAFYIKDQELWERVSTLHGQGMYRTALQEILNVLNEKPNDEGTLRLAALIVSGSRTRHLQAKEPLTPAMRGDTRLDPIYTQCSHCKNFQWVSPNWITDFAMSRGIRNPAGLQCQSCGYVMCRECLKLPRGFYLSYSATHSKRCPNCGKRALGVVVYPTGRSTVRLTHTKRVLSKVLVFREGPLAPDGEYIQELLENVFPEAIKPGVTFTPIPVFPWPDDISSLALAVAIRQGVQKDQYDEAEGKDMDGNRIYFLRVYQSVEYPPPTNVAANIHSPLAREPDPRSIIKWGSFLKKVFTSFRGLFIGRSNKTRMHNKQIDIGDDLDDVIERHIQHVSELMREKNFPTTLVARMGMIQSLMVRQIRDIALEELQKAFLDNSHHYHSSISNGLGLIVSAFPTTNLEKIRTSFSKGYTSFLDSETRQMKLNFNKYDLAHWVLCSDGDDLKVHLTYMSGSNKIGVWALDLLTPEEKQRYVNQ